MYYGTPPIVTNGLVLYLDAGNRLSYVSGSTTWNDLSGNNSTGSLLNGTAYSSDNQGTLLFDGINDYVDQGNPSSLNFGTGSFTVSVWFRRLDSSTTNLRILSKGGASDNPSFAGFAFFGSNNDASFVVNPSGSRTIITAVNSYNLNEWVNLVGILERGVNVRIYKNTTLTATATAPTGSVSGTFNLFIGASFDGSNPLSYWTGSIANVQIYNRALSEAEITQNYNALKTRFNLT